MSSLTAERLREALAYCRRSGVFHWKEPKGKVVRGARAGCLNRQGYMVIRLDDTLYTAHRLAYLYVCGVWPPSQVDHRNRVRTDNRWSNLRDATNAENGRNSERKTGVSGYRGVHWVTSEQRFVAKIRVNYRTIRLGCSTDPSEAARMYDAAALRYHGDFATLNNVVTGKDGH